MCCLGPGSSGIRHTEMTFACSKLTGIHSGAMLGTPGHRVGENCLPCHRVLVGDLEREWPTGAVALKPPTRQRLDIGCLEGGGLAMGKILHSAKGNCLGRRQLGKWGMGISILQRWTSWHGIWWAQRSSECRTHCHTPEPIPSSNN